MQKSTRYTIIFVFIAIFGVYFSYRTFSNNIKQTSQDSYSTIIDIPTINNAENIYKIMQDDSASTILIYEMGESIRYLNIILEDVPKAKDVKEYYKANESAINDIYSFSSYKEFEKFYDTIKNVYRVKNFELVEETLINVSDKYSFKIRLIGIEESEVPMQIYIQDKEKSKAKCYWNKENLC